MRFPVSRLALLVLAALTASCARSLPPYEKPIARAPFQTVRTTAYTHTEADHRPHGTRTAAGGQLQSGPVKSAACDWSRWPVGTVFRLQETGEVYRVDDYGWALAGTNTIDLYKPSRAAMNAWGVRRVNLEILEWGDVDRSLAILRPRRSHAHVERMVTDLRRRYAELTRPFPLPSTAAWATAEAPVEEPLFTPLEPPLPEAQPATVLAATGEPARPRAGGFSPARPQLTPFLSPGAPR